MGFLSQPISIIPVKPIRKIDTITVNVVINENAHDILTITKQPVQRGAQITDHSFQEPTVLSMSAYFNDNSLENLFTTNLFTSPITTLNNNNGLAKIYKSLLDLQGKRQPIDIVTPKRIYQSMLISSISQTTDKATENCLRIDISFQQIIIVDISTVQVPRSSQRNPGKTGATQPAGRKQSALFQASQLPSFIQKIVPGI